MRRGRRGALARRVALFRFTAVVAFVALALARPAFAQPARSRVALVRNESSDALLREANTRLRAELGDAGFDVVEVDRAPGDAREGVEGGGGESFATVSMNRAGAGAAADVWISDHVTGKTVVRRLQVGGAPNAASVLAIRALELLRASLLEVAAPEPSTSEEPPRAPPPDVLRWVEPTLPPRPLRPWQPFQGTTLGVGATGLHGLRGVGLAFGPTLRLSHSIAERWFARLTLTGPLVGPEITEAQGSAAVRQEFASADLGWASRARPVGVYAWVGVGAFDLHVTGSAIGPYRSRNEGVVSFLSMAGLGGVAHVGGRVAFTVEITALSLIPQPLVVIADHEAGKAGAPSLGMSLGLLVGL
jgi:hypothetical protein